MPLRLALQTLQAVAAQSPGRRQGAVAILRCAFGGFWVYTNLTAAYAHAGKMEEAKTTSAEARRLNPAIMVKWMMERSSNLPAVFDGLRKTGLPKALSGPRFWDRGLSWRPAAPFDRRSER
jgi:hypothetical protein